MQKRKRILIICPYPRGFVPSQRFRFEQYIPALQAEVMMEPFFTEAAWSAMGRGASPIRVAQFVLAGIGRRISLLFKLKSIDLVFIHREAAPIGPPVIEWLINRLFDKKFIYDFDDAIWLTDRSQEAWLARSLRARSKVKSLCRWADKVSCGNRYLAEYAGQFNSNTVIIPTTIDTQGYHNPALHQISKSADRCVIGWTGSSSTLKYLRSLVPVLRKLAHDNPTVHFVFTADIDPGIDLPRTTFVRWQKENEIGTLLQFDIGIMPLPDDPWTRGKGGFKALQYLALEIPAVASAVGINTEIVQHRICGFLAGNEKEWLEALQTLIADPSLRRQMGIAGRAHVVANYSVEAVSGSFLKLFE